MAPKKLEWKVCPDCHVNKPRSEFYEIKAGGLSHRCKPCAIAHMRAWREANPERHRDSQHRRRPAERNGYLQREYKITAMEYDTLLAVQGGLCAICRKPERVKSSRSNDRRKLGVDHDHVTGKVRGLLCHHCNVAIGHLLDDPEMIGRVVQYLVGSAR